MKKHNSQEAFYQRLQQLAEVKKPTIKESTRNLGTLIDYKRAADGVAYGIVKENHQYFVKKGGLKQDPNVSDFAYIGGLENITKHQYKSLAEADKQRNMLFQVINEAVTLKPSKTGSKKQKLHEDKAGEEIEMAASKVGDLEAATAATEVPAEPEPDFSGEPMGDEEMPAEMGGEEMPVDEPAPEGGEELPADMGSEEGGEEMPAEMGGEEEPEGGEEMPAEMGGEEEPEGGEGDAAPAEEKDLTTTEIEKGLGKLTNKIRKTELEPAQVKSYVNSFLTAFKDKFDEVEIEDRKAMADKILKVVPDEDIEDIEVGDDMSVDEPEEVEEAKCSECGSFGMYAESRGYTRESIMECGEEEMANLVSGYANAHGEGQNDGDFKAVALFITPEIMDKLKGDYGHDEYASQLEPMVNSLSEASEEDKAAQIDELWGGMKQAFGKVGGDIKAGAQKAGQAVAGAAQKVGGAVAGAAQKAGQAVGQYATDVKQAYHTGEVPGEIKKLETVAASLGKQIAALNTRLEKAGKQPVNVRSILATIQNQLGSKAGTANLSKFAAEGVDPAGVEVQPNALMEDGAEEIDDEGTPEIGFAPDSQTLGVDTVKPAGAPTTGVDVNVDAQNKTVNVTMSESEKKIRKYIRERLEVKAGLKKASLNEDKKSDTLKRLDKIIDEQFGLYESVVSKKKDEVVDEGITDWMGKASQWAEGRLKKQKDLKAVLPSLSVEEPHELNHWLNKTFKIDFEGGIERYLSRTPAENKLVILQQAAADPSGLGKLKIGKNNFVEYIPVDHSEVGGPSDFARGRSRLGT
jgi:hypothetical protein